MLRNERGSMLVMAAVFGGLFFVLLAVALDFGMLRAAHARLRTGYDAAAIGGVMESDKYANLRVRSSKYVSETCWTSRGFSYDCSYWDSQPPFTVERVPAGGAEAAARRAAEERGWRMDSFETLRTWAELRPGPGPEVQARQTFERNTPWAPAPDFTRSGRASLRADGRYCQPTVFLRLFGVRQLCLRIGGEATAEPN